MLAYIAFVIDTELGHLRAATMMAHRIKAKDRLLAEVVTRVAHAVERDSRLGAFIKKEHG